MFKLPIFVFVTMTAVIAITAESEGTQSHQELETLIALLQKSEFSQETKELGLQFNAPQPHLEDAILSVEPRVTCDLFWGELANSLCSRSCRRQGYVQGSCEGKKCLCVARYQEMEPYENDEGFNPHNYGTEPHLEIKALELNSKTKCGLFWGGLANSICNRNCRRKGFEGGACEKWKCICTAQVEVTEPDQNTEASTDEQNIEEFDVELKSRAA